MFVQKQNQENEMRDFILKEHKELFYELMNDVSNLQARHGLLKELPPPITKEEISNIYSSIQNINETVKKQQKELDEKIKTHYDYF